MAIIGKKMDLIDVGIWIVVEAVFPLIVFVLVSHRANVRSDFINVLCPTINLQIITN